ncbi:antigen 5 like allergen Cul n 1-like [Anopheles moucheti]|uniref:antigen 5 like allergen Cul n 1-like n=1 Tax=Anopheles moucheti TaxID=186751 RepID=UPI0022F06F6C|nr:antigen 5 like allergen Cul n 1-like [Anopheles moucheti]
MASWIFVTIACCLLSSLQAETDYCTTTYCSVELENVGCNPPPATGGPACDGKSAEEVVLDSNLQSLILYEHNTRRSKFALGQLESFLPATRMPTITWDTKLAKQAGHNARSCIDVHDSCRNTRVYRWAGQNIILSKFGSTMAPEDLVKNGINIWWSEYKDTTQDQLNSYPAGYEGPAIGHFTQMVSDQTDKLGCAIQHWLDGGSDAYYFVCNYAVTNALEHSIYKNGTVASACTTGPNPIEELSGLCSPDESINPVPNQYTVEQPCVECSSTETDPFHVSLHG